MNTDEKVVHGVLCYELAHGEIVKYTSEQLTTFLMKAEQTNNRLLSRVKELEHELTEVSGGY